MHTYNVLAYGFNNIWSLLANLHGAKTIIIISSSSSSCTTTSMCCFIHSPCPFLLITSSSNYSLSVVIVTFCIEVLMGHTYNYLSIHPSINPIHPSIPICMAYFFLYMCYDHIGYSLGPKLCNDPSV